MAAEDIKFEGDEQVFQLLPEPYQRRFLTLKELCDYVAEEAKIWKNVDSDIFEAYVGVSNYISKLLNIPQDTQRFRDILNNVRIGLNKWRLSNAPVSFKLDTSIASDTAFGQYLLSIRSKYTGDNQRYREERYLAARAICNNSNEYFQVTSHSFECMAKGVMVKWADLLLGKQAYKARECLLEEFQSRLVDQDHILSDQRKRFDSLASVMGDQIKNNASEFQSQIADQSVKYDELTAKINSEAENIRDNYKKRIKELEGLYTEKLQLDGPAKYWRRLARGNFYKGIVYMALSVVSTVGLALMVYSLLVNADVLPIFNMSVANLNFGTVRASLMLLVFTSAWGYVIHLLTRLGISSFHLHRDYTERLQLTRVYLALLKNDALKDDVSLRNIVMQALFCRSDTGLLKNEGGIKMPMMDILSKSGGE